MKTQSKSLTLALTTGLTLVAAPLAAQSLNFAYGYPQSSAVGLAVDDYAAAVSERSDGAIDVTGFAMSLLSLPETSPGVRDGLADVGFVLPPYYPAEYSTNLFLHELNQLINLIDDPEGKAPLAYTGAMMEYTLFNCPECLDEYAAQNQVFTGGGVTPLYNLLCNDVEITEASQLEGMRLRAGGAGFVRFAEHFGAQGVRLPVNEAYEALDQGILDCAMLSAPELTNYNLHEVVTDITLGVPGGAFAGVASANVNKDAWNGMSPEMREVMLWGGSVMTAATTWNFYTDDLSAIEHARENGINIVEPSEDLVAAMQDFNRQDLETVSNLFSETYGVERSAEIAEEFRPILERWYGLVADVDSQEALQTLLWDEVVSKVDPATYAQ